MVNAAKPLSPGDKVYVKKWGAIGEIVAPRPSEPLEPGRYHVAVRSCFSEDELDFDATEAEIEKRQQRIIRKTAVVRGIHQTVQNILSSKLNADPQLIMKYVEALDDLRNELGEAPLFESDGLTT
jgi:hypothetical protein